MRAIVTCECCDHRHKIARPVKRPETFHLICHRCEVVLYVDVTEADFLDAEGSVITIPPSLASILR